MTQVLSDTGITDVEFSTNLAYDAGVQQSIFMENLSTYAGMLLVFLAGYLIIYNVFQDFGCLGYPVLRQTENPRNHQKTDQENHPGTGEPAVTDRYSGGTGHRLPAGHRARAGDDRRR